MKFFKKFFLPVVALAAVAAVAFFAGMKINRAGEGLPAEYFAAEPQIEPARPVTAAVPTSAASAPALTSPGVPVMTETFAPTPASAAPLSPPGSESGLEAYFRSLTPANSEVYTVQAGDTLTKISKLYGVTTGQIMAVNGLQDENKLRVGMKLKIMKDKWKLVVDKTTYTLYLKAGDYAVKTYRIGTGKDNSTPVGEFKIVNRLKNPTWYHDGTVAPFGSPENPLGTRWMGFDAKTYGLHGTTQPESIGKSESLGCIRMLNSDVEELYELLPVGTAITILESPKAGTKR